MRPGRFDRTVEIPLPNQAERKAILAEHASSKRLGADVDLGVVARGTPGFAGADLANLVNEAAIVAVRHDRGIVTAADFQAARDRILMGRRDASNALLPDEKHAVAVHESGHSLVAALCLHADPVAKVTILPAGQALGLTEQLPIVERHLYQESYLYDSLAVRLAGRAAEDPRTRGSVDRGGQRPGRRHAIGRSNGAGLGHEPCPRSCRFFQPRPRLSGRGRCRRRAHAEETQRLIDQEVSRLLREAEHRATDLLSTHRHPLDRLIALLEEKETVNGADVYAIIDSDPARRPGINTAPTDVHNGVPLPV